MRSVSQFVRGVPYGQDKVRGDTKAPAAWTERVVTQTVTYRRFRDRAS
jgi:hypothetical protein